MLVLAALALGTVLSACADKEFADEYGPPPTATSGVSAWIVSGRAIWHTSNGGAEWDQQVEHAGRSLIDVAFADGQHGWAVGMKGFILATSDGGETWTRQATTGPILWYLTCVDPRHAWAIGPYGALVRTSDGGRTWRRDDVAGVDMVDSGGGDISFADARHGWIAAGDSVRATSDGGATWTLQHRVKGARLTGVACGDAAHVWAVGTRGALDEPVVVATSDGGSNWTPQHVPRSTVTLGGFSPSAIAATDASHAWAASSSQGPIAVTSDGGRTWRLERVPGSVNAESIAAADVDHIFLTTGGQPVMVSDDGGRTWAASGRAHWLDAPAQGVAAVMVPEP